MKLYLRPWKHTDLDSLVKYADNYNIARFLTDQFPHPYTRQDGEKFLALAMLDQPVRFFAIEVNGEVVGSIGVFPQTDIHARNAEMGYWLAEPFWGQGIMTQAIREMVKYGFETFNISRIYARPFGSNLASQKILQKAGFTLEAKFPGILYKNGEYEDELVFAIRSENNTISK